jgi:hypothetical protein
MCCCSCWPACLFTAHVGSGSSPLSCGVFLPLPFSQVFLLLVAGHTPPFMPSPARPSLSNYSSGSDSPFPLFSAQGATPSLLYCLYCSYCLLFSFSFFPGWRSVCPGDYADLAQGCLWEYRIPLSSPCLCLPKLSRHQRLAAARGPSWFLHST